MNPPATPRIGYSQLSTQDEEVAFDAATFSTDEGRPWKVITDLDRFFLKVGILLLLRY